MIKHVNPKDFLHQVYTKENGVKEHNKNQRAIGFLIGFASVCVLFKLSEFSGKIERLELKAKRKENDAYAHTMPRMRTSSKR